MKIRLLVILLILSIYNIYPAFKEYKVSEGETIYGISRKFGITAEKLCEINNIKSAKDLKIGSRIKVPADSGTVVKIYTVEEGDNLFRIGMKYNMTVSRLCELNGFSEKVKLYNGMKIKVIADQPIPQVATKNPTKENTQAQSANPPHVYTVKKGDTLYDLSRRYGVATKFICNLNKITEKSYLYEGMKLKLKDEGSGGTVQTPQKETQFKSGNKEYLEYGVPLDGRIKPFVNSHYRGLLIFSAADKDVISIEDGVVTHIDERPSYGLIIFIRHNNGVISTYNGFKEIYVKKDSVIKRGQVIGKAGFFTKYNEPGIMFSIIRNGKPLKFDMNKERFYL